MSSYTYTPFQIDISGGVVDMELEVSGENFQYLNGTQTIYVRLDSRSNGLIPLNPKDSIPWQFERLYITAGPFPETIDLLLASPRELRVDSNQFVAKLLERDISDYYDVLNGASHFSGSLGQTAVAGQYSAVQVFNPVGSGIVAVLRTALSSLSTTAGAVSIGDKIGSLATLVGNGLNFYVGKSVSKCEIRRATDAVFANLQDGQWVNGWMAINDNRQTNFSRAHIIPEGFGAVIVGGSVNMSISGAFEWEEIAI